MLLTPDGAVRFYGNINGTNERAGMAPRYTQNRTDDQYFPVRVRVAVPRGGFGYQLDIMHGWLDQHAGVGRWAAHSANLIGLDAVAFYFMDAATARGFIDRFACGMAIPAGTRPQPGNPDGHRTPA